MHLDDDLSGRSYILRERSSHAESSTGRPAQSGAPHPRHYTIGAREGQGAVGYIGISRSRRIKIKGPPAHAGGPPGLPHYRAQAFCAFQLFLKEKSIMKERMSMKRLMAPTTTPVVTLSDLDMSLKNTGTMTISYQMRATVTVNHNR